MNENLVKKATSKVTSMLYNEYKDHKTMVDWGENDWRWKKNYLKNVAFTLVTFALYGRCAIAPEAHYEYLVDRAKNYQEPVEKYRGLFAIDKEYERHLKQMDEILCKCLHDQSINARNTNMEVLKVIEEMAREEIIPVP